MYHSFKIFLFLSLSLLLLTGCPVPEVYRTKVWEDNKVLNIEQQGKGTVEAKKTDEGWEIKTDYKASPLLMDVTKLVAVKEINED